MYTNYTQFTVLCITYCNVNMLRITKITANVIATYSMNSAASPYFIHVTDKELVPDLNFCY